jgi:hypothetical protein
MWLLSSAHHSGTPGGRHLERARVSQPVETGRTREATPLPRS